MREHDGHTIALPYCAACPDLTRWPVVALVLGRCPNCGRLDRTGKSWRVLAARRLIEDRESPDA